MPTIGTLISDGAYLMLNTKNNDQQEDAVEYEPTSQPEIYCFLTHEIFQNSGGHQQNNLLWTMKSTN